jgi:hypothetical protein
MLSSFTLFALSTVVFCTSNLYYAFTVGAQCVGFVFRNGPLRRMEISRHFGRGCRFPTQDERIGVLSRVLIKVSRSFGNVRVCGE